jgi:hypothetical protein
VQIIFGFHSYKVKVQFERDYLSVRYNVVNVFEFPVSMNKDDNCIVLYSCCFHFVVA